MTNVSGLPRGVFLGLATLDVLQYVDHPPGPNEKATSFEHALAAGGPATNAAVTFAALGGRAVLVTALATDPPGDLVRAELASRGVEVVELAPPPRVTPVSSITVATATGERSIVGSDAAGAPPVAVDGDALRRLLAEAEVLLLDGHYGDAAVEAARLANDLAVPVVLDVGRWKPAFDALVGLADHVVCSEAVRPPGFEGTDHAASIRRLAELGAGHVVVTRGGGDVLVRSSGAVETVEVPVPRVGAVDTLGAGDAFHGAYAHAVASAGRATDGSEPAASGASMSDDLPRRAAAFAAGVAATRVQHRGPRAWLAHLTG
ncbi:MAG: hypothetical protein BGO96_02750 [Micrococcales bacterium 73-15]|uniref:PfkB family carbohydrate kinase n=1 Tax=Salana multivorans TaxID=120377 RepID=UPI0009697F43|nr:PfkB family carbohydrate kinase [Salana multivorans]OJX96991.1 MAG: hypothetical protein BGO96_02750 [Micrococcales bacterium 73-15]